jgi:hypothetical protein
VSAVIKTIGCAAAIAVCFQPAAAAAEPLMLVQANVEHGIADPLTGKVSSYRSAAFDLGTGQSPKLNLHLASQAEPQSEEPARRGKSGRTALLIIGGVLVLVVLAAVVAASVSPPPGPSEGDF